MSALKKSTEIHKITKSTKKSMTGLNIHRFFSKLRNPRLVTKGVQKSTVLVTKSTKRQQWTMWRRVSSRRTTTSWLQLRRLLSRLALRRPTRRRRRREGASTSQGVHRMEALDTLQCYLLGVSNSDRAQMSLLSVEQFLTSKGHCTTQMWLQRTSDTTYCFFTVHRNTL